MGLRQLATQFGRQYAHISGSSYLSIAAESDDGQHLTLLLEQQAPSRSDYKEHIGGR
jgi:hypothetical protein